MSEKVISGYLKKISPDDPLRELFFKHVLPSLRNPQEDSASKEPRLRYTCGLCMLKTPSQSLSFTNFYAYLRHLGEKHEHQLPCNGNIFNTAVIEHRCDLCEKKFSRKEHYQTHLRSQSHIKREQEVYEAENTPNQSPFQSKSESRSCNTAVIEHRCDLCDMNFKRKDHYQSHLRSQSHIKREKEEYDAEITPNPSPSQSNSESQSSIQPQQPKPASDLFLLPSDSSSSSLSKSLLQEMIGEDEIVRLINESSTDSDRSLPSKQATKSILVRQNAFNDKYEPVDIFNIEQSEKLDPCEHKTTQDCQNDSFLLIMWINSNQNLLNECDKRCQSKSLSKRKMDGENSSRKRVRFSQ